MEQSKDFENRRGGRLSFFEKMAMIEPKVEVPKKERRRTYGSPSAFSRDRNEFDLAAKGTPKHSSGSFSFLSSNKNPKSKSRCPSPSKKADPDSNSPVFTKTASANRTVPVERNIFDRVLASQPHSSVGELSKSSGISTSTCNASPVHIKAANITQTDCSSTKPFDHSSSPENSDLRKTPIVCLEIMQKDVIDKHMSSNSPQSSDKNNDMPISRAKLVDVARSSPRSSPKLGKKPFRRTSVKNVSDSKVESVSGTKVAKTLTKSSAVSPIKCERPAEPDNNSRSGVNGATSVSVKSILADDSSSTHSSVDQEIVQIIPRFGIESNTGEDDDGDLTAKDDKSVDSVELCSSVSQQCSSLTSTEPASDSVSFCEAVESRDYCTTSKSRDISTTSKGRDDSKFEGRDLLGNFPSKETESVADATTNSNSSAVYEQSLPNVSKLKIKQKRNKKIIASQRQITKCGSRNGEKKSKEKKKKEKINVSCSPRKKPLDSLKRNKRSTLATKEMKEYCNDLDTEIEKDKSGSESSKQIKGSKKRANSETPVRANILVSEKLKNCKAAPLAQPSSDKKVNDDNEVNDTERLLGTVTRSGRKVKISTAALEALEASTMAGEDVGFLISPELTAGQLGHVKTESTAPVSSITKATRKRQLSVTETNDKSLRNSTSNVSVEKSPSKGKRATQPETSVLSKLNESVPSVRSALQSPPQAHQKVPQPNVPLLSPARSTRSSVFSKSPKKQIQVQLLEKFPRTKAATPSPTRNVQSPSNNSKKSYSAPASTVKSKSPETLPGASTRAKLRTNLPEKTIGTGQKTRILTAIPPKEPTFSPLNAGKVDDVTNASSSSEKTKAKGLKLSPTARKSCRQTLFLKESAQLDGSTNIKVKEIGSMGNSLKELLQNPLPLKTNVDKTSPVSSKEAIKTLSKQEARICVKETRSMCRSKGLESLITQVEDRLKTVAPVPVNLKVESSSIDQSESFFSGGSSSEESGSSEDPSDEEELEEDNLNLRLSEDGDSRETSEKSSSHYHSNILSENEIITTSPGTEKVSPEGPKVDFSPTTHRSMCQREVTPEAKKIYVSPPKMRKLITPEKEVEKNSEGTASGADFSVFERDTDNAESAFSSNKLDEYLSKYRDINHSLKDDPTVFKPLSPPSKYTASNAPHTSPAKQISLKPDIDDIDGIKFFRFATIQELDIHVRREKAIVKDWNYDIETENFLFREEAPLLSKTNDFSKIKGWRNKMEVDNVKPSKFTNSKLYAARGLIRSLGASEITELGLRLKPGRSSPVLLHKEFHTPEAIEKKTNVNIYGRKPDGRFATKRSIWPKKRKGGRSGQKNEAGWREGWWNPVNGNSVRPEVVTSGIARIAASALFLDADENIKYEFDVDMCDKLGCRYGCVCHLCEAVPDTGVASPDPLPELDVDSSAHGDCVKEYCRLGCICESLSPLRVGLKPTWKKKWNQHCGRPDCMFGCECGPKTRAMLQRKPQTELIESAAPVRLLNTATLADNREDDLDARMIARQKSMSAYNGPSVQANVLLDDESAQTNVKKESLHGDVSTDLSVKQRGRKRKQKNTKKESEEKPKRKYVPRCSAEERQLELEKKLATARKSSRLTGHQSLAKIEKLNSLIYYDTAAWVNKENRKSKGNKGNEDDQEKQMEPFDIKKEVESLETTPEVATGETSERTLEEKASSTNAENTSEQEKEPEDSHTVSTSHSPVDADATVAAKRKASGTARKKNTNSDFTSCARTAVYTGYKSKLSCLCLEEEKMVHKTVNATVELISKDTSTVESGRRHSLDDNSASLVSRTGPAMARRNSTSGVYVCNMQGIPHSGSPLAMTTYSRFRTQMVVLQRTTPHTVPETPENKRPHLLEISSNCDWEPIRSQLLGRMSAVCSVMGDFPPEMRLAIEQYSVVVLAKPDKTTPIPANLQPVLRTHEMFAIRLKITPLRCMDSNQPPELPRCDSVKLPDTSVKKLEQISKAPVLAGMLATPTPTYASPLTDHQLGISGFKRISFSITDGNLINVGSTVQNMTGEIVNKSRLNPTTSESSFASGEPSTKPSATEPIEIIPISDESSSDCSPSIQNVLGHDDPSRDETTSRDEETVTVTIDENLIQSVLEHDDSVNEEEDDTSQEGDRVTVTIDEEMVESSNEPDTNVSCEIFSEETLFNSVRNTHGNASGEMTNKCDALKVNEMTDEDGSQDSIVLHDLRPSSSCCKQSVHDDKSTECESQDPVMLLELESDTSVANRQKTVSPTTDRGTFTVSCALTVHADKDGECKNTPKQKNLSESENPPVRLENGSVKVVSVNGVPKQSPIVGLSGGKNQTGRRPLSKDVLHPKSLNDQKPLMSLAGLTLIPVTAVREAMINGTATMSYSQDKIAMPVSVICSSQVSSKSARVKPGARRNSTGAAVNNKSQILSTTRSPSADSHSRHTMTLSHFIPVSVPSVTGSRERNRSSGDIVISSFSTGANNTKAFIPLDHLSVGPLSGISHLPSSGDSAFRPISTASPVGSAKDCRNTKTPSSINDEDIDSGRTSTMTSSCDWDDDGIGSDISVGVEDTCFSGVSISIDEIEEDAVKYGKTSSSSQQKKRKRKQGLLERPASLVSVEFVEESCGDEGIKQGGRRGKEHQRREKQRRSDIRSGFTNLYTVLQERENLPDARNVTKIVILKKAIKVVDKLKKDEERLVEEKRRLKEINHNLRKITDRIEVVDMRTSKKTSDDLAAEVTVPRKHIKEAEESNVCNEKVGQTKDSGKEKMEAGSSNKVTG